MSSRLCLTRLGVGAIQRNYGVHLEPALVGPIKVLMAFPEEYLEQYPVPCVMTLAGGTQSAAIDVRLPRVGRPSA